MKRRPRRPGGIAPGLLVAAPSLVDPSFVRTVVLLVEHGGEGSLGIVVNRPADVRFEEVLDSLGLEPDATPALAPFPLHSLINGMTVTNNSNTVSQNMQERGRL